MRSLPKNLLLSLLLLATALIPFTPAQASKNGVERSTNTFAVGFTFKSGGIDRVCSGALISPIIIVTAGHCVYDDKGAIGTDYYFTKPGVALDATINPTDKQIKLYKVFSQPGFDVNKEGLPDDIAFLQLDSPIATSGFIRVATPAEVATLADNEIAKGYGFGAVFETGEGYSRFAREYHIHWSTPKQNPPSAVALSSDIATACTGDSGGPITTVLSSGEEVLLAVMSGAARVVNNCGTVDATGNYTMKATVVDTYLSLIKNIIPSPAPTPSSTPVLAKSSYFATTSSTKNLTKVSLRYSSASTSSHVGKSLQVTVASVGNKTVSVKVTIEDPAGKIYQIASSTVPKNKSFASPIVKFAKTGTYVITTYLGTSKKVITVKVAP